MAHTDFPYLYPYSVEDARKRDELDLWRQSHKANIACKEAIEAAIRRDFDGMFLADGCAKSVIDAYGYKRTSFVLACTLQELSHDGRFSKSNKIWGSQLYIPKDAAHNHQYTVNSHPAVLDGFIHDFREEYAKLALFEPEQCEQAGSGLDYRGRVLVMRPDTLKESYWSQENQLWYATGGFGCSPTALGNAVYATCLGDGEQARWSRRDFFGPIRDEYLPGWAKEKLDQIKAEEQSAEIRDCPGPEMKL